MGDRETPEKRPVLPGWSLLASAVLHGLVALILLLIALFSFAPLPEEPVIRVTLAEEGPGAAGAAGGAQGGGGDQMAPAGAPAAEQATLEPPTDAPPEAPATTPQPPQVATAPAVKPAPPAPPPPRRKPQPPHHQLVAAPRPATPSPVPERPAAPSPVPERPVPERPEITQAPGPSPEIAAAGAGSGPGGPAGTGEGAAGTGAGSMGSDSGPGDDYLERVKRWLARFQRYPEEARKQAQEGTVLLDIELARDGTVLNVQIARSSGYPLLDMAALDMVRQASPVPPFPAQYRRDRGTFEIPQIYSASVFRRLFGSQ